MFSVVIPVYNHSRYLNGAVNSCLVSELVTEILLVDDGSSDDSAELAAHLASIHSDRIRNLTDAVPKNMGAHNRLNQLCHAAKNEWIAVLNSDDSFMANRFEIAARIIREEKCDFISGAMSIVDDDDREMGKKRYPYNLEYPYPDAKLLSEPANEKELLPILLNQNIYSTTSNMLFKKSLFKKIGGFADLRYSHDWDFAIRACLLGKCRWTANPITNYRLHANNTIKEVSPHIDGEVSRFFYRILAEFPNIESDGINQRALFNNLHITPYASPVVDRCPQEFKPTEHFPTTIPHRALLNAALYFLHSSEESLIVDAQIETGNSFKNCGVIETNRFFTEKPFEALSLDQSPAKQTNQTVANIPGNYSPEALTNPTPSVINTVSRNELEQYLKNSVQTNESLPTILVFSIFMAVGGVERNTIEIMRELRSEYNFVVITSEALKATQGSLHYQLDEINIPCFDLSAISPNTDHCELLNTLKRILDPKLVWVTNGSPWLIQNATKFRRIFAGVPIIDQQVYDSEVGWIEHYHSKGIQSFDHFIAINRPIQKKFISSIRIPKHRVSLIYSAVNTERIVQLLENQTKPSETNGSRKKFAFIGRLTDQKQPVHFLQLVKKAQEDELPMDFIMVGDGDLAADCRDFAKAENLQNLEFIAYHKNTPELLSSLDGLISTSKFEGLPIVLLESLCVGTPAFCADVGEIGPLLEETDCGHSYPKTLSFDQTYQKFLTFIEDLDRLKIKALAQRDETLNRFSTKTIAASYQSLFNRELNVNQRNTLAT